MEHDDGTPTPNDRPTEPAEDQGRAEGLEAQLATARDEAKQANERWLRERADLENLKKRTARERAEAVRFGTEHLIRDLLPVVDNLERALAAAAQRGSDPALVEGVTMVRKALLDALEKHGVSRVAAEGERFDPTHHEAVAHVESEHEPNAVIAEHQPGYRLHERLLRPAMVTVSKGSPAAAGNLANDGSGD